jgi:hypothetical protein
LRTQKIGAPEILSGATLHTIPFTTTPFYHLSFHTVYTLYHAPYAGKSIALGGMTTAKLSLTLNLEQKAKLSFWYANRTEELDNIFIFYIE